MPAMTLPISWNEIQNRATAFAQSWAGTHSEDADAKPFWDAFFEVFGVSRRKVASFERRVHKLGTAQGKIDLLWKGTLLIEHKSLGRDLGKALTQAFDYFPGLKAEELPRYVLVCDFNQFELYDLEPADGAEAVHRFTLAELPAHIHLFSFIAGYTVRPIRENDPVNQLAVQAIGELHDSLKNGNYTGEMLEVFLVRLLFCLFADDTGIFLPKDSFHDLIEFHTREDGSDVGTVLDELFTTLNETPSHRQSRMAEHFSLFPYVNGKLFERHHRPPAFDSAMRVQLLSLCSLDWGAISPAIFGAMFQTVIELDATNRRRQLGAHYTSETNILKLLGPLCMDELRAEFAQVKTNKNQLFEFLKRLSALSFLDPACGCGNFLVIAYRELRELELDVLRAARKLGAPIENVFDALKVNVDQFYGIEIEEFPSQIAQVAMWLTDHQMNVQAGAEFGRHFSRIPLVKSASIRKGNALDIDWAEFVPPEKLDFIIGNPPFIGSKILTADQKTSLTSVLQGVANDGILDFFAGWYIKAGQYISSTPDGFGGIAAKTNKGRKGFKDVKFSNSVRPELVEGLALDGVGDLFANPIQKETKARRSVRCAFVSTNSICQGEQVGVLWGWMLAQGIQIQFAHRTFQWTNDAPGKAAVHCVIVGFGMEAKAPRLFDYEDIKGNAHEVAVRNVNPYLVDAPTVVLPSRREPICKVQDLNYGSFALDDGNYTLDADARNAVLADGAKAKKYVRPFIGGQELLNAGARWCLWLKDGNVQEISKLPEVMRRIEAVKAWRLKSGRATTVKLGQTPMLFAEVRQPTKRYIAIPTVSSERRQFIPIAFLEAEVVASNQLYVLDNATPYEFGILSSTMHNAWVRYTCGRLESRYRYSAGIVYNNYPWPEAISDKARQGIASAAQAVLDARAVHQTGASPSSLATLYNPTTMPANLLTAHKALDKAVDAAYAEKDKQAKNLKSDAQRVAFLFGLYERYTSLLG
jgi:N-6 DNA Methylase